MRPINFKNGVLYPAALKVGLDPNRDFQSNQMLALVAFINLFVARFWDKSDFPEWTTIQQFTPVNHVVEYEVNNIWRVFKVYILDPTSTLAPCDTPFRLLDIGVHCGFDHGSSVWIKFLGPPPKFSGELWNATKTYNAGDVVYLAETGECYSSIGNNNINHYPGPVGRQVGIPVQITQPATESDPGLPGIDKIVDIDLSVLVPDPSGTINNVAIFAETPPATLVGDDVYDGGANATQQDIRDGLIAALSGDGAFSGWTFTPLDNPVRIRVQHNSDFYIGPFGMVPGPYSRSTGTGVTTYLKVEQAQGYMAAVTGSAGQRQFATVTFNMGNAISGQIYSLRFIDEKGVSHSVSYTALATDTLSQVMAGLMTAVSAARSTDAFFNDVFVSLDLTSSRLIISTGTTVNVDATMQQPAPDSPTPVPPVPQPPSFWTYVPFPERLALQVIEGAYSDYLKMEGQTDKGMVEEKGAMEQQAETVTAIVAPAYSPLTDQETREAKT